MAWRFPLPPEVRDQATGLQTCLNPGLWLDHFTEWEERRGELKRAEASDKRRRIPKSFTHPEVGPLLLAYRNRWDRMIDALGAQNYIVQKFTLRAASRVIVGLGAESVLETSIRLHRIYGFPIIPGSALKGVTRAYARLVEGKDEDDPTFEEVFGKSPPKAQAGKVIFFDAIPANPANLTLELDVMNPHYGPYYQRSEPPADYHNPEPVFFLTIGPGSEFLFAVASRERGLAQKAQQWLTCALTEMGIGAKTVAGYGLWTNVQENSAASSDPGRSTAATSPQPEPQPPAGRPDRPEVLKELPRKADAWIPAEVVDNTTRPMKVRLFVEGYLDRPVDCSGVGNPNSFPRGTFVRVAIVQRQKDGTVTMVRLVGLWRAS
jgi:CRISPR-associated protein Cmr6